jgi:hypothetical protein
VTYVVLDTKIGRLLRSVRIIVDLIMVHAVLRLVRKLFTLQAHQCCQRKIDHLGIMHSKVSVFLPEFLI